ncbi:hypothetical protein ACHAWF_002978, partial [Thalassiosira exigua]
MQPLCKGGGSLSGGTNPSSSLGSPRPLSALLVWNRRRRLALRAPQPDSSSSSENDHPLPRQSFHQVFACDPGTGTAFDAASSIEKLRAVSRILCREAVGRRPASGLYFATYDEIEEKVKELLEKWGDDNNARSPTILSHARARAAYPLDVGGHLSVRRDQDEDADRNLGRCSTTRDVDRGGGHRQGGRQPFRGCRCHWRGLFRWAWISSASPLQSQWSYRRFQRCTCPAVVSRQYPVLSRVRELGLLKKTAKLGVLSKLENQGLTLRNAEQLLPVLKGLGVLGLVANNQQLLVNGVAPLPLVAGALDMGAPAFFLGAAGAAGLDVVLFVCGAEVPFVGLSAGAVAGLVLIPLSVVLAVVGGGHREPQGLSRGSRRRTTDNVCILTNSGKHAWSQFISGAWFGSRKRGWAAELRGWSSNGNDRGWSAQRGAPGCASRPAQNPTSARRDARSQEQQYQNRQAQRVAALFDEQLTLDRQMAGKAAPTQPRLNPTQCVEPEPITAPAQQASTPPVMNTPIDCCVGPKGPAPRINS